MRRKLDVELKAGIFLFFGLFICMLTILFMGGIKTIFEKDYHIHMEVSDANGIAIGGAVRSGGLKIGTIDNISFTPNYNSVLVNMKINQEYQQRIRQDSVVRFQSQGVLGDKFLEVAGGTMDKPVIADGGEIQAESGKDFNAMIAEGSNAVALLKDNLANLKVMTSALAQKNQMAMIVKDLQATTANLKDITADMKSANMGKDISATLKNLRVISDRLKNGEGTIGALFADSTLYEDLKNLIGGANRNNVLKFFVRQAVKSADEAAEEQNGKKPTSKKK